MAPKSYGGGAKKASRKNVKRSTSAKLDSVTPRQRAAMMDTMAKMASAHPDCQIFMAWPGLGDVPDYTPRERIVNVFKGGIEMSLGTIPKGVYQPSVHNSFGHIYDCSSVAYGQPPGAGLGQGSTIAQQYRKFDNIYDSESEGEEGGIETGGCAGCAQCNGGHPLPYGALPTQGNEHHYIYKDEDIDDNRGEEDELTKRDRELLGCHGRNLSTPEAFAKFFAVSSAMMPASMMPAMKDAYDHALNPEMMNRASGEMYSSTPDQGGVGSSSGGHSSSSKGSKVSVTDRHVSGGKKGGPSKGFNFAKALETAKVSSMVSGAVHIDDNQSGGQHLTLSLRINRGWRGEVRVCKEVMQSSLQEYINYVNKLRVLSAIL